MCLLVTSPVKSFDRIYGVAKELLNPITMPTTTDFCDLRVVIKARGTIHR
jgi:hypothetical protein